MGAEDNPFVRFKNYIDNNARRGFDALFGSFAPPSPTSSPSSSPSSTISPSTITSSHRDSSSTSSTPMTTSTHLPSQEQQQEQQPQTPQKPSSPSSTPSWPLWSSIFKMPGRVSPTASSAAESDQHSTPPTTPTSTTTSNSTTPTVTMDDVHTWSVQSTYSPLNLQHLPQPTPRVFPHVRAEGVFTFRDAFEDLLVAGSGQPLPSDRDLMRRKIPELLPPIARDRERGSGSNGLHVAHWVSGIAALGLWDAYFRLEPPARTMTDTGRFQQRRMYFGERGAGAAPFGTSFGSTAAWGRRGGDRDGVSAWRAFEDREVRARANFGARGAWDSAWRFGGAQDREWDEDENENQRENRDADVEDELYRTSRPTRDVWRVVDADGDGAGGLRKPAVPPEVTTTVYADGSRSVTTTERRREENGGKTRVTTTAQHFDAAGNLVSESRESSSTRTWSGKIPGAEASFSWSWNSDSRNEASREDREGRDREDDGGERKDEKSGWFWKR